MQSCLVVLWMFLALFNACTRQVDKTLRNAKVTRYPNGNIHTVQEFIHDTIQDGAYVRYYEDATVVEIEILYSNNLKNGLQKSYYRSGRLESVANFVNGIEEGNACWYHENGTLSSWVGYMHGSRQSPALTFYNTGEPKAEIAYGDSSKVVYRIDYGKDGAVIKEGGDRPERWKELVNDARLMAEAADTIAVR